MTADRKFDDTSRAVEDALRELRRLQAHVHVRAARSNADFQLRKCRTFLETTKSVLDVSREEIVEALTSPIEEEALVA